MSSSCPLLAGMAKLKRFFINEERMQKKGALHTSLALHLKLCKGCTTTNNEWRIMQEK
jgi:hypothetical protein